MPYTNRPETQAYIDEAKTPSVQTAAQCRDAVRTFLDAVNKSLEQGAVYGRKADAAEMAETDSALDALYKEMAMHGVSLRRVAGEAVRFARELAQLQRQVKDCNKKIRDRCAELHASDADPANDYPL